VNGSVKSLMCEDGIEGRSCEVNPRESGDREEGIEGFEIDEGGRSERGSCKIRTATKDQEVNEYPRYKVEVNVDPGAASKIEVTSYLEVQSTRRLEENR